MRRKTTAALVVPLAFVVLLGVATAALAKSQPVAASGSWTWVGYGGTDRVLPSGAEFLRGYEIGQWTGTFTATDTYEPYVAMVTKSGELWAKLWIHFEDADVAMGRGGVLHGDMTMLVIFHAGTADAAWKIHNGTGQLRHLGGEGTLAWTDEGMDYAGMIWTQR